MRETAIINVEWDPQGCMYVAQSDDIPGLVTESETFEGLIARVMAVLPDLLLDVAGGETLAATRSAVVFHLDRTVTVAA